MRWNNAPHTGNTPSSRFVLEEANEPELDPPRVDLENIEFEIPGFVIGFGPRDLTEVNSNGENWRDRAEFFAVDVPIDLGHFAGQPISSTLQAEEIAQFILPKLPKPPWYGLIYELEVVELVYDPDQNLWIFSFMERGFATHPGFSVAIDGRAAEVLIVWAYL